MYCQLGYIWIASRKSNLKDVVKLLWYVPDINDKEEKGIKVNFRVSSLGNYVISEVIENNGDIERECRWRERKKRAQVSGLPVLTGHPRWRCSIHRTYRIRRKMIVKGSIHRNQTMVTPERYSFLTEEMVQGEPCLSVRDVHGLGVGEWPGENQCSDINVKVRVSSREVKDKKGGKKSLPLGKL